MGLIASRLKFVTSSPLGLFGGTFDPPHFGHLAAASRCREALGLDKVLLVVANDPWQKSPLRTISPAKERMAMVSLAIEGLDGLEVCDLEINRGGESFTIDTVEQLAREGVVDPWIIVGSDLSLTMDSWERSEDLRKVCRLAVLSRPGSPLILPDGWRAVALESEELDISSSAIRERWQNGLDVQGLVPKSVIRHLEKHSLYSRY